MSFIEYMQLRQEHPPRCVAGQARRAGPQMFTHGQDEYGPNTSVFDLTNADGGDRIEVRDEHVLFAISADGERQIFDAHADGWDAENGEADHTIELRSNRCDCGHDHFQLTACFQYAGDDEDIEGEPDIMARRWDYFDWFSLYGVCTKCDEVTHLVDNECA